MLLGVVVEGLCEAVDLVLPVFVKLFLRFRNVLIFWNKLHDFLVEGGPQLEFHVESTSVDVHFHTLAEGIGFAIVSPLHLIHIRFVFSLSTHREDDERRESHPLDH